ncbi:hypothetical protein CUMW_242960 [Citrus unshiu]|uniref:Protein kinase domain-containing protein n=1 Tax=Citrus unshiu TaxID=55188 RepID=A0A2H5QN40_CITUN|nr:hypothetical protein CUMW_242960 [Citrus unshiu]
MVAKRCLNLNGKKQPTMKEVALELAGIRASIGASVLLQYEEIDFVDYDNARHFKTSSSSTGSFFNSVANREIKVKRDSAKASGGVVDIFTKKHLLCQNCIYSGIGCCHIPLPQSLKSLNFALLSIHNHTNLGEFMTCDYALLADEAFNIAEFQASKDKSSSNVTIEWVVEEKNCPDDPNSKVDGCGDNTNCYYSENGKGYRCKCKQGFQGNPYLGCVERRKQKNFLKNGGEILKHQSVRIFNAAELVKATENFNESHFLGEGGFGSVYKGVLPDNTQIAVKKPKESDKIRINQEFQKEMGIVSRINHKNVVKILGLCLQTKVPLLVYEFVSNGTLSHHIHDKSSQVLRTWKMCLRIAAEIASALDYFHSLASPPIIHGDVKSSNILLDDEYTAKVADFGASVLISPDQAAMATKVQGTFGYLDPEYLMTGNLTEKSDVYSFGVVLVELLTGVKPGSHMTLASNENINIVHYFLSSIENNDLRQILTFRVADESEMEEVEIVAELASECLRSSGVKRPTMKRVSEELDKLKRLLKIYGHRRTVKRQSIC